MTQKTLDSRDAKVLALCGIATPELRASFESCEAVHRTSERPTYLAAEFLPFQTRPYVHALYAFLRATDDIADEGDVGLRVKAFADWHAATLDELRRGRSEHPLRMALVHTVDMWELDIGLIEEFLQATASDITRIPDYVTFEELREHLRGVLGTITLLGLPLLQPTSTGSSANRFASVLGEVIELVDIFRDLATELPEGRCYLPREDLDRFGLVENDLANREPNTQLDELVQLEVDRGRSMLEESAELLSLVHPSSRPFLDIALIGLHSYLDEFARRKSDVFRHAT